jgi:hypothetical protein
LNFCFVPIPLKNSAVQRYGPVSRVFDGSSETTILQRIPRLGPGYAAIISIRALAGLNLASRRKFCAVAARRNSSLATPASLAAFPSERYMRFPIVRMDVWQLIRKTVKENLSANRKMRVVC